MDYESHAIALDRNELGALLVAAGLGLAARACAGLRAPDVTITRKGGKVVMIPLAPRTARVIDLAIGERTEGPVFLAADGRRLDRHGAGRVVRKVARDVQEAASHADSAPRCGMTEPAAAWTGTRPISSPRTSRVPPGNCEAGVPPPSDGHGRQMAAHTGMVTDRDLNQSVNRYASTG